MLADDYDALLLSVLLKMTLHNADMANYFVADYFYPF